MKLLGRGRMHAYISTENLRSVQSTEEQEEAGSPTSVAQVDGVIRRVTSAPHPRGSSAPIMNPDIAQTRSQSELASIGRCYIIESLNNTILCDTNTTCHSPNMCMVQSIWEIGNVLTQTASQTPLLHVE